MKNVERGHGTKVSAIILSWQRPREVGIIVEELHKYSFIDEIVVAVNKPDDNKKCYKRWLAAMRAKNNIVYVQDDDCIIENIQEIYDSYDGTRMAIGTKGTHLTKCMQEGIGLVGWGTILNKRWIDLKPYLDRHGEDEILIRDADRIVTYAIGVKRPHNYVISTVTDFESASGDMAMYRQPEHWEIKNKALERAKELYA